MKVYQRLNLDYVYHDSRTKFYIKIFISPIHTHTSRNHHNGFWPESSSTWSKGKCSLHSILMMDRGRHEIIGEN